MIIINPQPSFTSHISCCGNNAIRRITNVPKTNFFISFNRSSNNAIYDITYQNFINILNDFIKEPSYLIL